MKDRILLGMSSGIDSSVSAILLKNKGFDVAGITFIFSEIDAKNSEMIESARQLADSLHIEYYVVDLREEFNEKVISYFKQEYVNGKTPFPCAVCNPEVKFRNLIEFADKFNCNYISTGHYVQVVKNEGIKYISKGVDGDKDQSFFLWGLSSYVIDRLMFPLGKYTKKQVREIAQQHGFSSLTQKKESLGICFIEGNDYRKYLKDNNLISAKGDFINNNGEILGQHKGYINYTVGQRRGLGLHLNKPMFISEIRPQENQVVLSEFEELAKTTIYINNYHFVHANQINNKKNYIVRIRYRLQETLCRIHFMDNGLVKIALNEPVSMVANGQTAVFYEGDRVIGGGFIVDSQ